jgi:hypothetical protein
MTKGIVFLKAACPLWFEEPRLSDEGDLCGVARVEETKWRTSGIALKIRKQSLTVGEEIPGTALPFRCAERHIQADHTFCTGLDPICVDGAVTAWLWWERLRQYLWLQSVAAQTGVWPDRHYLDHGLAGNFHQAALRTADKLDLQDEYDAAYDNEPSWITDPRIRLTDRKGMAINGRAACPLGCKHGRSDAPKLRRSCSRRRDIANLAFAERSRRNELNRYWEGELNSGAVCCGSMRDCPLDALAQARRVAQSTARPP